MTTFNINDGQGEREHSADMTPRIGDNSSDPHAIAYDEITKRLDAFIDGAEVWSKRKPEEIDADLAGRANDYLAGCALIVKDAEAQRVAEKEPHLTAGKLVDTKWKELQAKASKLVDVVKPLLAAHLKREEAKRAAARAEAERIERESREAAEAARRDAEAATSVRDKIKAAEAAEHHEARAATAAADVKEASAPARVDSATGLTNRRTLRKIVTPEIVSLPSVFNHYREEKELIDLLLRFAARDLRAAETTRGVKKRPNIPGIKWIETEGL